MSVIKEKIIESDDALLKDKQEMGEIKDIDNTGVDEYKICEVDASISGRKHIILYSLVAFFSLIIIILAIIVSYNIFYKKIFSNMYINDIEVSGMTKEQAIEKIEQELLPNLERKIILKNADFEYEFNPLDIGASYNVKQLVEEAYRIGRGGNIIENNIDMLKTFISKTNLKSEINYDNQKLDDAVESINTKFSKLVQSSYEISEDKIVIKKGQRGVEIKEELLKEKILENLNNYGENVIEFGVVVREPNVIDLDSIYTEVYKEPVNAYYTTNPFEIHESKSGVDFAITLEEAKALLEKDQEEYIIGLKKTAPTVTTDQIGTEAFPDLLATCSSPYIVSKIGRTTNLKLASAKINGYVLMPGETFSYNKVVGERTVEAGFQLAGVYSGGQVVDGLGGGICQVSSTLYNIAVVSNLEIVQRENHTFLPGYLPAGRDATVVYGAIDFKFKNTRNYPVKIISNVSNGYVTMKMYGLKVENEPVITFETVYHQTLYPQTIYKDTTSLPEGQTKVESSGQNGCKSTTYKVVKQNGQVISKTVLSTDTYKAMNKIILRGVKVE